MISRLGQLICNQDTGPGMQLEEGGDVELQKLCCRNTVQEDASSMSSSSSDGPESMLGSGPSLSLLSICCLKRLAFEVGAGGALATALGGASTGWAGSASWEAPSVCAPAAPPSPLLSSDWCTAPVAPCCSPDEGAAVAGCGSARDATPAVGCFSLGEHLQGAAAAASVLTGLNSTQPSQVTPAAAAASRVQGPYQAGAKDLLRHQQPLTSVDQLIAPSAALQPVISQAGQRSALPTR